MLFSFLITIFSTSFITIFVKYLIHRPRPELATYFVNSYSFPSFHSAISVAFYGFLAWLLIRKTNKWNEKVNWFI
jgi:membrane-associated phospholipid phosphatase